MFFTEDASSLQKVAFMTLGGDLQIVGILQPCCSMINT